MTPDGSAVVNFSALAVIPESGGSVIEAPTPEQAPASPLGPSPAPATTFQGMGDIQAVGGQTWHVPPGTNGAVGPDKIFTTLNNNYQIKNKATGAAGLTIAMEFFWEATGARGSFYPKTLYDPYNNRFIVVAVSDRASSLSSLLVGVSHNSDPGGFWSLFRFKICETVLCAGGASWWADAPSVGFSKNWLAVSVNMLTNAGNAFTESRLLVFDYPAFRAGHPDGDLFQVSTSPASPAIQPCTEYSNTENTLFATNHVNSAAGSYRLNTITGTPTVPLLTMGAVKTHTLSSLTGGWSEPTGNILPQATGAGGETSKIDGGGARIQQCVLRNNSIWYAQTVGLPAGGAVARTAAQWVKLTDKGNDADGGRIVDPTATATNGGKWYAYPSIAVNKQDDALIGFTQFSSAQFPSAGYAFRAKSDPARTTRDPYVYRAGQGHYWKPYSASNPSCTSGLNLWGSNSLTQPDPSDDLSFWTLQELSKPQGSQIGATGCGSGVWDTWWAKVAVASAPTAASVLSLAAQRGPEGAVVRWRTGTESRILGFNLWRDGRKANRALIAARHSGEARGASYRFVDRAARGSASYRLQVVDLNGKRSWVRGATRVR